MNPDGKAGGDEDGFSLWLADCDDRLVAGDAASAFDHGEVPDTLRVDLQREVAWCQTVRRLWPHAAPRERGHVADLPPQSPTGSRRSEFQLGRFLLKEELGRGSFGVVYLAHDPELQRDVALKVPRAEALVSTELRARFRNEALAAAGLAHPNIVPVYEAGDDDSVCYIASEYCPGITLAAWMLRRTAPVPHRVAARLVATLAEAVDHAHGRGVLHRDLKPSNVMIETSADQNDEITLESPTLTPRITDFGLAKLVNAEPGANGATQSDVIMGSPSYMAPEQAEGRAGKVGPGTDIYSLGVILYELLTGRPPFQTDSALETLVLARTQDPLSPSRLRPRIPRDLEMICLKCLRRYPQGRYATAAALADDLKRFLAAEPVHARATPTWERAIKWAHRHPAAAALVAALCVAAIVVASVIGVSNIRLKRKRDRSETRRLEAVANLRTAREAVDRMLTRVSQERLRDIPQVDQVRLGLLQDASEFYRDLTRQAHDDPEILFEASQAHRRLGDLYHDMGHGDEAHSRYQEALAIQQKLAGDFPDAALYRREQARTLRKLGTLGRISMGDKTEALNSLQQAIGLLEKLGAADPSEPGYGVDLAAAYEMRGLLMVQRLNQPQAAEDDLRKAVRLVEDVVAKFPADRSYQDQSAVLRYNLACLMVETSRLDDAEKLLRPLAEYWEKKAATEPAVGNYRSKLALTLESLADVLEKTNRIPEAERAVAQAADLRSKLTKDSPDTPWHFLQLGNMRARLANFAASRGDLAEARRLEEQAIQSKRACLALSPRNDDFRREAGPTHAALIETLTGLREHQDAARAIAELVSLLPESGPVCFRSASLLARCVPVAAADTRLASTRRAELSAAYANRAGELIREAAKRGYRNVEALKTNPDFDPLRSRRFSEVARRVRSN